VATDALNRIAKQVPQAKQTGVRSMVAESDATNRIVIPVPKAGPINALPMVEVKDVLIALIGLIVGVVVLNTMDIVQHASNVVFQQMHAVKLSMPIQKK
jgi:hypothetical protein